MAISLAAAAPALGLHAMRVVLLELIDDGLADEYEVLNYPTRVVIDRNGRVRYRVEGFTEESFRVLEGVVERLLAES